MGPTATDQEEWWRLGARRAHPDVDAVWITPAAAPGQLKQRCPAEVVTSVVASSPFNPSESLGFRAALGLGSP